MLDPAAANQKVVEEAPSPFVTPKMRKAMGEQWSPLWRAVGYYRRGHGRTDRQRRGPDGGEVFYFLEMNTRLQS